MYFTSGALDAVFDCNIVESGDWITVTAMIAFIQLSIKQLGAVESVSSLVLKENVPTRFSM